MSSITFGGAPYRAIPRLDQAIYINGSKWLGVELVSVQLTQGLSGARATFASPRATFDQVELESLRGAHVVAYAWPRDGGTYIPLFRGFIDSWDARLSVRSDMIAFQARSPLAYLDRLQLGQTEPRATTLYRRFNRETRAFLNWTVRGMIQDAFDSPNYPSDWDSELTLGDTSGLETGTANQALLTDTRLVGATFLEFLGHMLALAGNVGVRERFTASQTFLDFYRLGPNPSAAQTVYVAAIGDSVASVSVNVSELDDSRDLTGIVSRVVAYTGPKEIMVTIGTDHAEEPLVPLWPNATPYDSEELSEEEQAVLDDPSSGVPNSPTFVPGREKIFRHYGLPAVLRNYVLAGDLPVTDGNGSRLQPQVFFTEYAIEEGTSGGAAAWVTDGLKDDPRLLAVQAVNGPAMEFLLAEPAVRWAGQVIADGIPKDTFERVDIYATVSLLLDTHEGGFDTGRASSVRFSGMTTTGLTATVSRPDLEYVQLTSRGSDILDRNFDPLIYDATWYDGATWDAQEDAALVIRDDRPTLARIAQNMLNARGRERRRFDLVLEYLAPGLRIGDTIRVNNGGALLEPCQIQAIVYGASDENVTRIVATNVVPETVVLPSPTRSDFAATGRKFRQAGRAAASPLGKLGNMIGDAARSTASLVGRGAYPLTHPKQGADVPPEWAENAAARLKNNPMEGPMPYQSPISTARNAVAPAPKPIETIPTGGGKGEYAPPAPMPASAHQPMGPQTTDQTDRNDPAYRAAVAKGRLMTNPEQGPKPQ